jgi:drug/metabolite transporter (DMT)-like permease
MNKIEFFLYLVFWYAFTLISVIYTKLYLNITNDSFTFIFVSFCYGFLFKVLTDRKNIQLLFTDKILLQNYLCLSLFNIGSILLTNISINQTSVSFIYIIKASEPIFVLVLSCHLLGHTYDNKTMLMLIQICFGVTLTILGDRSNSNNSFMFYALFSVFFANLSTAARSVFYKLYFQSESSNKFLPFLKPNSYQFYFNITFFSFLILLPFYLVKLLIMPFFSEQSFEYNIISVFYRIITSWIIEDNDLKLLKYLFIGSILNFSYNLFSFKILENVSSITHSVINIMKRMFVVFGSMLTFSTTLGPLQVVGIVLADSGCLIYSYLRTKSNLKINKVNLNIAALITKFIIGLISSVLVITFLFEIQKNNISSLSSMDYDYDNITQIDFIKNNELKSLKEQFYRKGKSRCVYKVRQTIIENFRRLLPKKKSLALLQIPDNENYEDLLIWYDFMLHFI